MPLINIGKVPLSLKEQDFCKAQPEHMYDELKACVAYIICLPEAIRPGTFG
jgi:hypothetical protein